MARIAEIAERNCLGEFGKAASWRVVYIIDNAANLVSITRIAHRREIYER